MKVLHVIARMNVGGTANYVSTLVSEMPDSILVTGNVQGKEIEDEKAEQEEFDKILERQKREKALDEMVRISQELGLYDDEFDNK